MTIIRITPTVIGPEMSLRSLVGSRVTDIGRTKHRMEIGFDRHRLTAYCPLRVVRGDQILLGMADMNCPEDRSVDSEDAYQSGATMYDRNAKRLTDLFASSEIVVLSAELDFGGAVGIEATDNFRFEVVPTSVRRRLEAWRLVSAGEPDLVYPD
jgi:hypothetical protein